MRKVKKIISCILIMGLMTLVSCEKKQSDGKGYLFNYTMMENPQNLDPQIATDSNSITVIKNTFTGLMTEDENGNIVYGVAESHSVSNDGLRYVFNLRKDYKWYTYNGTALDVTSYDFLFTFQRIFNPETRSPYGKTFLCLQNASYILDGNENYSYKDIGVYASDKYTLTFILDYPNPNFLELLSQSCAMPCNEEFFYSTHSTYGLYDYSSISNGAFYIKQWFYDRYGNQNFMTLRKNPINPLTDDYSPYAVQLTIDEDTNLSEVQHDFYKDKTDLYYSNDTIDKSSIDSNDTLISYDVSTVGLAFNLDDEYFYNSNLRNAFKYSIDRKKALKKTSSDIDTTYSIVPSNSKVNGILYRDSIDDISFSTRNLNENTALSEFEIAKNTLEFDQLPTIRLIMQSGSVDTSYIKPIIDNWEKLFNITIVIDQLLPEDFQNELSENDFQMAIYTLNSNDGTPYSFLSQFSSSRDFFGYSNLEVDTILNTCEKTLSIEDKFNLYSQIENTILDDNVFIPLYSEKSYLVYANGIDKVNYNPFTNVIDFRYSLNYNQD
ncbi:MAG: peptide ABC transporter substrate-binding protein [Oscillospiraceae bacterium]